MSDDFIYSDPGPAIDFYMRSQKDNPSDGDSSGGSKWGCLIAALFLIVLCILFYEALEHA